MFGSIAGDTEKILNLTWEEIEPYYRDLQTRTLSPQNVDEFLLDWTTVSETVDETYSRLNVAVTVNTQDGAAEEKYNAFLDTIYPKAEAAEQQLRQRLIELGVEPAGFAVPMRKLRTEAELFREENLPLITQDAKLANKYDKIVGAQTVQWEGKEVTVSQLRPVFQNTDRQLREQAWRLGITRQLDDRDDLNKLWAEFLQLRLKMACNAQFGDYRSFRWKQLLRFDYTPKDCAAFHDAIEKVVVPAAGRVYQERKKMLGLSTLRPWDIDVDPFGRGPLTPFNDIPQLLLGVSNVFRSLDNNLYMYFKTMLDENLLDLDNRKNKAPGGYCTEFPVAKRPFIFMNAVGLHDDVQTLLHESGHAFHCFERTPLPYHQQRQVGMEFSEVASMGMELLATPYLAASQGGFYSDEDAARARLEHLERSIVFWPYMALVDAFQHWAYENPESAAIAEACDNKWTELWDRFMPWLDWTGLENELSAGWQRKLHIFVVPFYYVEYGLAQLGAVQIWRNSLKDRASAVNQYRRALALGGTVPLPDLFSAAGAEFAFSERVLASSISLMEQVIQELRGSR
jgi:oligoendopeptidase F